MVFNRAISLVLVAYSSYSLAAGEPSQNSSSNKSCDPYRRPSISNPGDVPVAKMQNAHISFQGQDFNIPTGSQCSPPHVYGNNMVKCQVCLSPGEAATQGISPKGGDVVFPLFKINPWPPMVLQGCPS